MAKKMDAIDAATKRATKLGYCLQALVTHCLKEVRLQHDVHENVAYHKNAIKPDFFLGKITDPIASLHITSSDSRESFRMKRWRYICELFQVKQFAPRIHAVNVFWGTADLYQPGDIELLKTLFDSTLDLREDSEAQAIYQSARHLVTNKSGTEAAHALQGQMTRAFQQKIATAARLACRKKAKSDNKAMWQRGMLSNQGQNEIPDGRNTSWVRPFLRSLLLNPDEYAELLMYAGKTKQDPPEVLSELQIVETRTGIVTRHLLDRAFQRMLENGVASAMRDAILSTSRYQLLIREARDSGGLEWAHTAHDLLRHEPSLPAARRLVSIAKEHPRFVAIDAFLATWDVSANSLEVLWDDTLCRTGVKNPIANLASKTRLIASLLSPAGADALARTVLALWKALVELHGSSNIDRATFEARIQEYRRYCLFSQKTLKPIPFLIRHTLTTHGWSPEGKVRYVFSSASGGGVGTEFQQVYSKGSRMVMIKSLFGSSGADHKAEEMAGRLFLLPFRQRAGHTEAQTKKLGLPLFLPEGDWKPAQLELLASAGWNVVAIEDLEAFLDKVGQDG